jgi:Protein kinase domain
MERLLVLYKLIDDNSLSDDHAAAATALNAFELIVQRDREVYLLDILAHFNSINIGTYYRVSASTNLSHDLFVYLDSPSSIVPVLDNGSIYLHLNPISSPVIIPTMQGAVFTANSRCKFYSRADLSKIGSGGSFNHAHQRAASRTSSGWGRSNPKQRGDRDPGSQPPVSRTSTDVYHERERERDYSRTSSSSSSANQQYSFGNDPTSAGSNATSSGGLVGSFQSYVPREESVAAITEAAKEATMSAARSLFNFAAQSVKTVQEVASTVVANQSNPVVQIGNTKVQITRELAEGGFGKVFVVQDMVRQDKYYAMKQMICQSKEQIADAQTELQMLKKFAGNESIVALVDHCSYASKPHNGARIVMLLFPLYPHGTVWDAIERSNPNDPDGKPWPFSEKKALRIVMEVAQALRVIHDQGDLVVST